MSQVLVGEIVFKLKADADNMVRSLRRAADEVRRLEADQKRLTKTTSETEAAFNKEKKALDANSSSMRNASTATRNLNRDKGRMSQVVTGLATSFAKLGIKVAVVLPLLKIAAQAIGAATVAAYSLVSALAPLAGALALYPALLGAAGTSFLLLGKSLAPVVEALKHSDDPKKYAEALRAMDPPARQLTQSLASIKRELNLTSIAQAALFPSLSGAIDNLSRGIPNLQRATAMLGTALGRVADHAGRVFSSTRFLRDFDALAASNARTAERFGRGLVNLGRGIAMIMVEAIPLVDKLGQGFERMTLNLNSAIRAAADSGRMDAFFFRTYSTAKLLGDTISDVAMGLKAISGNGASALGMDMLKGLEKAAAAFRKFTESVEGGTKIRKFFLEMGPVISEFGLLVKDVVKGLAKLATGADGALVFKKIRTELLPALMEFVGKATTNIIPALIDTATAITKFASAFAFGPIYQILSLVAKGLKEFAEAIAGLPQEIVTFTAALFGMYKVVALFRTASLTGILASLAGMGATSQKAAARLTGLGVASTGAAVGIRATGAAAATSSQALLGYGTAAGTATGRVGMLGKAGKGLLAALGGIPGIAIAASAAVGFSLVNAYKKYKGVAEEATVASKALVDPATMDFSPAIANMEKVQAKLEELSQTASMASSEWSVSGWFEARGAANELKELEREMRALKDTAFDTDSTVIRLSNAFGITNDEVITLANRLGVDLKDGIAGANDEFSRYFEYMGSGTAASQNFNEALEVLNNNLSTAAEQGGALGTALESLGNTGFVSATIDAKDAVASLAESFKENGKAIDTNTDAGRRNLEAGLALAAAATKQVEEAKKQKKSQEEINEIWNSNVRAMEAAATKAGLTKDQIKALGEAIGLIPDMPNIVFGTSGYEGAQNALDGLKASIRAIDGSTPEVIADANVKAAMEKLNIVDQFATGDRKFDQDVNGAPAKAALDALQVYAETGRIMPVDANTAPGRAMVTLLANLAGSPETMPVGANTGSALREILGLRSLASKPVFFTVNGITRRTGGSRGGLQEADGGIVSYYSNGGVRKGENHVAQIAPAGAWRVWAEPETGGEAYIPLALSKRSRSLEILKQTAQKMGAKVSEFANGSPIKRLGGPSEPAPIWSGTYTPGSGLVNSAGVILDRGGQISDLQALIASYQRYIKTLADAAAREQLLLDIAKAKTDLSKVGIGVEIKTAEDRKRLAEERIRATERVAEANKRLAEFDNAAFREKEIASVEALIEALQNEARAREEAAAHAKMIQDNMFRVGDMATEDYIAILDQRIAAEVKYTDEWTALVEQRKSIIEAEVRAAQEAADELRRIAEQKQADLRSALGDLNALLDRAADLRASIAREEADHARTVAEIQQRYQDEARAATDQYYAEVERAHADHIATERALTLRYNNDVAALNERYQQDSLASLERYNASVNSLLSDRHSILTGWARLDQQAGPLTAVPVEWLISNTQQQIEQFNQWSEALAAARERGVSEEVISALNLDAGPQSLGQLLAFAAATDAEITSLNELVIARSAAAGEQVAKEAATTNTALNRALVQATETYLAEVDRIRSDWAEEMAILDSMFKSDIADNNATLAQSLADANAIFSKSLDQAMQAMNKALASERERFYEVVSGLETELASLGAETGRSLADAIAEGLASGIPGIEALVNKVIALAEQAKAAAAAVTNTSASAPVATRPRGSAKNTGPFRRTGGLPTATYDSGGILSPGLTMAYNHTGRNEYIMTGEQILDKFAEIAKVGHQSSGFGTESDVMVNVYLDGELVRGMARAEIRDEFGSLSRTIRAGRRA